MIISPGRRAIFVHIPKTGGTAFTLAYEGRARADDILIGDTPKAVRRRRRLKGARTAGRLWKHATLADVEGLVSAEQMRAAFVFTLVRNPWDRMVSYYHWLRDQRFEHPAVALARALDFTGFVRHPDTTASWRNWPARRYVTLPDGTEHCGAFVRLERLAEEIAPVEAALGLKLGPIARANASQRARDFRGYYDDETAAHLAQAAAEDIARFGYGFTASGLAQD